LNRDERSNKPGYSLLSVKPFLEGRFGSFCCPYNNSSDSKTSGSGCEVEQFFNDGLFGIDLIKTSNAQD